jgi:serine/threonine-protein kinase
VKLAPDGEMKVLGFGLGEPWPSRRCTASEVLLCTAPYMSPEQARGQAVDRAADIWAFGVILYEMLTGTRRFLGDTTSDVLEAVLRSEVEWGRLPAATPPAAARLLRRCLERDPRERLHDFASARIELTQALRELVSSSPSPGSRGETRHPRPWPGGSSFWRQRSWPLLSRRADDQRRP